MIMRACPRGLRAAARGGCRSDCPVRRPQGLAGAPGRRLDRTLAPRRRALATGRPTRLLAGGNSATARGCAKRRLTSRLVRNGARPPGLCAAPCLREMARWVRNGARPRGLCVCGPAVPNGAPPRQTGPVRAKRRSACAKCWPYSRGLALNGADLRGRREWLAGLAERRPTSRLASNGAPPCQTAPCLGQNAPDSRGSRETAPTCAARTNGCRVRRPLRRWHQMAPWPRQMAPGRA